MATMPQHPRSRIGENAVQARLDAAGEIGIKGQIGRSRSEQIPDNEPTNEQKLPKT